MSGGIISTWVGRTAWPMAAHVHVPADGRARGAVLLCPPIGRQQVASYRSLRLLADRLADRGHLVVRLALTGVSDSAPRDPALGLLQNWDEDLRAVTEQVRSWGLDQVHLVGVSLGGLVCARSAAALGASSLLMVDPLVSGRHFLRREQAMYATSHLPESDQPGVHLLGTSLGDDEAGELRTLKLADLELSGVRVGRVVRGDEPGRFPGADDTWSVGDDLADMLDAASMLAVAPEQLLDEVGDWLDAVTTAEPREVHVTERTEAVLEVEGGRVRESFVELPHGVPGILTEPVEGPGDLGVLFIASSSEPMDGPTGLWSLAARQEAANGAVGLRIDKHGTGELGGPEPRDPQPYLPVFVDDVGLAAEWLTRRTGRKPVGVGMCSGAYLLMVRPNARRLARVVGINLMAFDRQIGDIPDELSMAIDPSAVQGDEVPEGASRKMRAKALAKHHMPQTAWRWLGRTGRAHAGDDFLREAAEDTRLVLPFGPDDWAAVVRQRADRSLEWARRKGGPILAWVDPRLDHAIFGIEARLRCLELVADEVSAERRTAA